MSGKTSLSLYVLERIMQAIPLILAVLALNFTLIHLAPGDPIQAMVGDAVVSEEYLAEMRAAYGLDKPLVHQFALYLGKVVQGDLGYSFRNKQPVTAVIAARLWASLLLMAVALVLSTVLGIALGVMAARKPRSFTDNAVMVFAQFGYAVPVFWLGQLMIILFAVTLGVLPSQGMVSSRLLGQTGIVIYWDALKHLILPALVLSFRYIAINARITRTSMLEVMNEDYILTAQSKGLSDRYIRLRHGLRNALLPIVTVIGLNAGFLLFGSVLTETVFGWPGIGRLLFDATSSRDYPVIMAVFLLATVGVILFNLITDILYAFLDPRIRY